MPRNLRDLVTVSPPTFDRTSFAGVDRELGAAHAPFDRAWLMERFDEGLQIRMLQPPASGIVLFQPGRLCWRPIDGLDDAVVVHDLRVQPGEGARKAADRLWHGVEDFARFYGFSTVLAIVGEEEGLISPECAPRRRWMAVDEGPGGARLTARILQGPIPLPHFPRDWKARIARLGFRPAVQTTGESVALEARADALCERAARSGLRVRRERLGRPEEAQARAVSPAAAFSVLGGGQRIGGAEMSDTAILEAWKAQRPS
jgi:hypothetical protein